jgi:hypothetical protein
MVMKAYLFDPKTGLYEGETYEYVQFVNSEDGMTSVPAPDYNKREVPIYNAKSMQWHLVDRTQLNIDDKRR